MKTCTNLIDSVGIKANWIMHLTIIEIIGVGDFLFQLAFRKCKVVKATTE